MNRNIDFNRPKLAVFASYIYPHRGAFALDSVTEQRIQRSIDRLSEGKTVVVIAHRLSTIRNADRIAVVDAQHIVEQGTREELLARDGAYAALEHAQSQG